MKTRTLLLLSVGVGLAILLAGGVFLVQLSNESATVDLAALGEAVEVGDVEITVSGASEADGLFTIDVQVGGVDDDDGIDSFRLITGSEPLAPLGPAADSTDGRCAVITAASVTCHIDFDVRAVEESNRVLVLVRGDQQRRWDLAAD